MATSESQMNASPVASPTTTPSTTREWVEYAVQMGLIRTIPYSEFSEIVHLTRGGFGTILVASWRRVKVALKKLEVGANIKMDVVVKEIQLMRRSDGNEHIIRMYGISEHPHTKEFIIVMQYAANGTLREYLGFKRLDWPAKIKIASQIAKGLEFIHLESIAHRDLHSKNILVSANERILIADFGIAKKIDATTAGLSAVVGMPQYIPPERFNSPRGCRLDYQKGDIYALGFVLWELSSGRTPWEDCESYMIIKNICEGKREDPVEGTPADYVRLYQRCWAQEPENRPSVTEVLEALDSMSLNPLIPGAQSEIDSDSAISSLSSITEEIVEPLDPSLSETNGTNEYLFSYSDIASASEDAFVSRNEPDKYILSVGDSDRASPALEDFSKPDEPEGTTIWPDYKPDEAVFVHKPDQLDSGYQSASNYLQLVVFGKEIVRVDILTGEPGVITKAIPKMAFGIGSRAACSAGGKVYFVASGSGSGCLMSYDPNSLEVSIVQGERWDNTKSLTSHNSCIYSCGKRVHKIDLVYGKSTQIDTKGDIASKVNYRFNNDHSTVVGSILYFSEIRGILGGGSLRLWALDLSDPNGRLRWVAFLKLNLVALFTWEDRLCSLTANGEVAELDMQSGGEVRILSAGGGSPSACAVWGNSLFIVEQSGNLREVNLVTGVGRVVRYLQDVGRNVKSMVVV